MSLRYISCFGIFLLIIAQASSTPISHSWYIEVTMRFLSLFLVGLASAVNISEIPPFVRPSFPISTIDNDGVCFPTYQDGTRTHYQRRRMRVATMFAKRWSGLMKRTRRIWTATAISIGWLPPVDGNFIRCWPRTSSAARQLVSLELKISRTSPLLGQLPSRLELGAPSFSIFDQRFKTSQVHAEATTSPMCIFLRTMPVSRWMFKWLRRARTCTLGALVA